MPESKPKGRGKAKHEVRGDGSIAFYAEAADETVVKELAAQMSAQREKGS